MNVFLLAPRSCWHTKDLLALSRYNLFNYIIIFDTLPFVSRTLFNSSLFSRLLSFEFVQRLWRIVTFPATCCIVFLRTSRSKYLVHVHGLFALFVAYFSLVPANRIVFTPQGSDLLLVPHKYPILKIFLTFILPSIRAITADSQQLLDACSSLSNARTSYFLIQNGIDIDILSNHLSPDVSTYTYDLIWPRGTSSLYQFSYFQSLLQSLSRISPRVINVAIVGAYGLLNIPDSLKTNPLLNITIYPRLSFTSLCALIRDSMIVVSIPISDSSPRTVYESIYLRKFLLLTRLPCFNWIPEFDNYPSLYIKGDPDIDAYSLLNIISNYSPYKSILESYQHSPYFLDSLNYKTISSQFYEVFSNA